MVAEVAVYKITQYHIHMGKSITKWGREREKMTYKVVKSRLLANILLMSDSGYKVERGAAKFALNIYFFSVKRLLYTM